MPSDLTTVERFTKDFPIEEMRGNLLEWWNSVGQRHYPWRETRNPFKILAAEILLHRTRADQIVPLYQFFLEKYPNLHSIAGSSADELVKSFHSAGLHWRWKLFHSMAVDIEKRFNGQIPYSFEDLISLPGVSHYIASAVRCFALGYPDVLLDTNTVRVAGRTMMLMVTRRLSMKLKCGQGLVERGHYFGIRHLARAPARQWYMQGVHRSVGQLTMPV